MLDKARLVCVLAAFLLDRALETLGKKPTAEALDKLIAAHFPGFRLDAGREAILKGELLERKTSATR